MFLGTNSVDHLSHLKAHLDDLLVGDMELSSAANSSFLQGLFKKTGQLLGQYSV